MIHQLAETRAVEPLQVGIILEVQVVLAVQVILVIRITRITWTASTTCTSSIIPTCSGSTARVSASWCIILGQSVSRDDII